MEEWNCGIMEWWNVEALDEIPLRREKNGRSQVMLICYLWDWKSYF
jgi:hypothetical protein